MIKEGHKPEYESLASFGTMTLVDHTEAVIYANHLCNLYGLDVISAGATIAFAMECFEEGIINEKDTDGIDLRWGNHEAMIEILKKMATRQGFGDVLADGVRIASERLGKGAEQYAMHVGGQELPQHDPRNAPGFGTTYVVDPTPARHTQGGTGFYDMGFLSSESFAAYKLPQNDRYDYETKAKLHALNSHFNHACNVLGLCTFPPLIDTKFPILDLVNGATGFDMDFDGFLEIGERANTLRHCFNLREGIKPADFRLPDRVVGSPPLEKGVLKGVTIDIETMKKRYFEYMDWDYKTGVPSRRKIASLGLDKLIQAI